MTESITTRDELLACLEELYFIVCGSPRLYLVNYFSRLKSEEDNGKKAARVSTRV